MSWFTGRLLFESTLKKGKKEALFEEKWILCFAENEEGARGRLNQLARQMQHSYKNAEGNIIEICFREILEIQEVLSEKIGEGTEVFFRFWHKPTTEDLKILRKTHEST